MQQEYLTSWKKWAGKKLPLHFSSPRPLYPTLPPSGFVKKKKVNLCSRVIKRAKQQAAKIGNTLLKQLERLRRILVFPTMKKKQETVILLGETWQVFVYVCVCVSIVSTVTCVSAQCENLGTYICSANRVLTSWLHTRSCTLFPKFEAESKLKHNHAVASTPGQWTQRDCSDEANHLGR